MVFFQRFLMTLAAESVTSASTTRLAHPCVEAGARAPSRGPEIRNQQVLGSSPHGTGDLGTTEFHAAVPNQREPRTRDEVLPFVSAILMACPRFTIAVFGVALPRIRWSIGAERAWVEREALW